MLSVSQGYRVARDLVAQGISLERSDQAVLRLPFSMSAWYLHRAAEQVAATGLDSYPHFSSSIG